MPYQPANKKKPNYHSNRPVHRGQSWCTLTVWYMPYQPTNKQNLNYHSNRPVHRGQSWCTLGVWYMPYQSANKQKPNYHSNRPVHRGQTWCDLGSGTCRISLQTNRSQIITVIDLCTAAKSGVLWGSGTAISAYKQTEAILSQ